MATAVNRSVFQNVQLENPEMIIKYYMKVRLEVGRQIGNNHGISGEIAESNQKDCKQLLQRYL